MQRGMSAFSKVGRSPMMGQVMGQGMHVLQNQTPMVGQLMGQGMQTLQNQNQNPMLGQLMGQGMQNQNQTPMGVGNSMMQAPACVQPPVYQMPQHLGAFAPVLGATLGSLPAGVNPNQATLPGMPTFGGRRKRTQRKRV